MLGGGGAKGGYQLGVIRALQEEKLISNIDIIVGTSIGAINGLLMTMLNDVNKMSEVWLYAQAQKVYKHGFTRLKQDKRGLYSLDVLRDVFDHYIDISKIKQSKKQLYAIASKIVDPKKIASQIRKDNQEKVCFHINSHEKPIEAVIASASIPLFFGTTTIDDIDYVDGGILDNNPIDDLVEMGCDVILTVPLDNTFNVRKHIDKNILFVNFTDLSVFSSFPIQDAYDIIRFTDDLLTERENYGYLVTKHVIERLRSLGYLEKGRWGFNENFKRVTHFTYLDAPPETHQALKALKKQRYITQKETKKRQKIQSKIDKRITRGKENANR